MAYDELKIGNKGPARDNNNLNQEVYNVSNVENTENYNQLAKLWGEHYQTEQDPTKMAKFQKEMEEPVNQNLMDVSKLGASAFGEGETGMSSEDFTNLLYHTGFHESDAISGTPQMEQYGGGPGSSYFQVEPNTLRDLVTAMQPDSSTNPTTQYWGPKATELTGYSAKDLYAMSDDELMGVLRNPENQTLGAVAAGAKYAKSFDFKNKAVNDTMDSYNMVEDAFKY